MDGTKWMEMSVPMGVGDFSIWSRIFGGTPVLPQTLYIPGILVNSILTHDAFVLFHSIPFHSAPHLFLYFLSFLSNISQYLPLSLSFTSQSFNILFPSPFHPFQNTY
eukprot:NODE_3331_length_997_cov_17.296414_g3064_i0.p3 GENE.NODE_3331_length_997_cov_17.296414_g3064_i0~~NODE_3331_length_997_cov_17.296414_g3064_i0.p3  ORF type:complete len:107 (-),score=7.96 NODE_3331_length_997_cov_17.296414_g3064_i0:129-449(-)